MFIEIEDDIFDDLEKIQNPHDQRILTIQSLFESMYQGKHIVFSKVINLEKITKTTLFSPHIRDYVAWVIREFPRIYICKSTVQKRILVSLKYTALSKVNDEYKIPLEYAAEIAEAKLLTEHESDGRFYQQIAKYIVDKKKMDSLYCIQFDNDSYHGANVEAKIEQVAEKKVCALCIADTDKDFPEDEEGDTYRRAKNAVRKASNKIVIDLLGLPVREKENLFPASVYEKFSDAEIIKVISKKFQNDKTIAEYFDIKDGIKYKLIVSPNEKWMSHYQQLLDECKRQGICNANLGENELDQCYIAGIGKDLCGKVADSLFVGGELIRKHFTDMNKEQRNRIERNRNIILNTLPEYMIEHWKQISDTMFTWGCCINKEIFPKQRNW